MFVCLMMLASYANAFMPALKTSSYSQMGRRDVRKNVSNQQVIQQVVVPARSRSAPRMVLGQVVGAFAVAQEMFPVAVCMSQGCILAMIGEVVGQKFAATPKKTRTTANLCLQRLAVAGIAGIIFDGLAVPAWYSLLHRVTRNPMMMTALDLCLMSTFGNFLNMLLRSVLSGKSPHAAWKYTLSKIRGVVSQDLKVFPIYDFALFTMVPPKAQVLCTACACCLWNGYISIVTSSPGASA